MISEFNKEWFWEKSKEEPCWGLSNNGKSLQVIINKELINFCMGCALRNLSVRDQFVSDIFKFVYINAFLNNTIHRYLKQGIMI